MSLREKSLQEELDFKAAEDLFEANKTQILIFKNSIKSLIINSGIQRSFQSYCFEFCGMTGLNYNTLR